MAIFSLNQSMVMETTNKPLRGIEIIRKLLQVKEQAQKEAVETYRANPEIRAIVKQLKEKNATKRPR